MTSEPSSSEAGPKDVAAPSSESVAAENKRKMREALAAKQKRQGEDHIDTDPQAPQAHGPVDQKRTFRRKTG